jgi:hypothetical protein
MNEQILELAQLAVADAAKYCQRRFDLGREENETFALSFAELIVQKCADLVDDHDDSYPYISFGDMIKQHFGVE